MRKYARRRAAFARRMTNKQLDVLFSSIVPFRCRGPKLGCRPVPEMVDITSLTSDVLTEDQRKGLRKAMASLGARSERVKVFYRRPVEHVVWSIPGRSRKAYGLLNAARACGIQFISAW